MRIQAILLFLCSNFLFVSQGYAQTTYYKQINNEFDLDHTINENWIFELDLGKSYTSKPENQHIFSYLSQLYATASIHYKYSNAWRFTFTYAFYYNKDLPEINQTAAPEWRATAEAQYYFLQKRMRAFMDWRIEDRHIQNTDTVFEAVNRLRVKVKATYPINGDAIGRHVFYAIGSEEMIFKTNSKISGYGHYDRNSINLGMGYGLTRNMQMEVCYINEFLPRNPDNKMYNQVEVKVIFHDLFPRLEKLIVKPFESAPQN